MPAHTPTVVNEIGGRLRIAFIRRPAHVPETHPADTPSIPEIEVVAFADDCILSGRMSLSMDRLTDLLNENEEYEFVDVLVEDLDDGQPIALRELAVRRDELLIVQAAGPRGNAARRQRTRQHPIIARVGPYDVRGYVHALPGSDPIASLRHRKPMLALTDAVVEYTMGSDRQHRRAGVIVLNRDRIDWVAEGHDEPVARLELPVDAGGGLLKDFTGELGN